MANKKISELPAATSLTVADLLPVVQGGVTMQVTPDLLPLSTAAAAAATAAQNYAVQRGNHTGTQTADTITDGTTNKTYTATEKTKLAGIATGATANRTDAATDTAITNAINALLGGAPGALDTLKELADALGDDANYAATITTALAGKATPAQITAAITALNLGTASTHAATDFDPAGSAAAVTKTSIGLGNVDNTADASKPVSTAQQAALDAKAPLASPTLTGTPAAPTAAPGTNTTQIATTAFVAAAALSGGGGGATIDDTTTSTSKVWSSSKTSSSLAAFTKRTPAATYDATSHANGAVTVMDTGQTVSNFGAAPATVTSGVIVNTPTGSSPTAAYQQTDLGAKVGRAGATFELNGSEIVTLVVPSTTWTDGAGNMTTFNPAAAHFGITQTSWSYGIWTGSGQTILATGYLNLTNGVPYDVDLYFDGTTAYISFSDGTFATVTDTRISTYRASFVIWELYSNTSADTGAKLHKLWADIDGSAAAVSATDIARARSRTLTTLAAQVVVADEFLGGTTTSGAIGELGWTSLGGGVTRVNAEAGHPGVVELTTGATSGTLSALYLPGTVLGSELWDLTYWVRLISVDTSTKIRIGWTSDPTADAPTVAAYFEKLAADTHWWATPRVANLAGPRSDTGVTVAAGWTKFRIRQAQSLNFLFSINGGTELDVTQYLAGSSERIMPMVQITNSAAAAKTIDIDRVSLTINGLTR